MSNKILVAEDTVCVRKTVVKSLELSCSDLELEILQAGTRREALGIIASNEGLKVVVTDLRMPFRGDGEAVALSAQEKGIKVIVLSSSVEDLSEAVSAKCFKVLDKLCSDVGDLVVAVKRALVDQGAEGGNGDV